MFLGEIFQTQTIDGWPDLTLATKNWPDPGQKILTWTHHYFLGIENQPLPTFTFSFYDVGIWSWVEIILDQ